MEVTSATTASTAAGSAGVKLAQDFDTFLKLLTTQLQQQDPLDPLDSNQFTEQLVQFTSVEQAIQSNKNLETLVSLLSQQNDAGLVGYIGKKVTVESDTVLFDGAEQPRWLYQLDAAVPESKITVRNSAGTKVFETAGQSAAGLHEFVWNGKDVNGNTVPPGTYRMSLEATTASGAAAGRTIFVRDVVEGLERKDGGSLFSVGGLLVSLDQIVAVSEPDSAT